MDWLPTHFTVGRESSVWSPSASRFHPDPILSPAGGGGGRGATRSLITAPFFISEWVRGMWGVRASLLQLGPGYSRVVGRNGESRVRRSRLALLFVPTLD